MTIRSASRTLSTLFLFGVTSMNMAFSAEVAGITDPGLEDLRAYRSDVFEPDPSFSTAARSEAVRQLDALESRLGSLSEAEFELALAEVSALAQNGHSFLMPGGWTARYNRIPVEFGVFADGIYVVSTNNRYPDLVGQRLTSIDKNPVEKIEEYWSRHQGGLVGWRNQYLPFLLESPEVLFAASLSDSPDQVILELESEDGQKTSVTIQGTTDLPVLEGMDAFLAPSSLLHTDTVPGTQRKEPPLYLRQPDQAFRYESLPGLDAVYIQFKANADFSEGDNIKGFMTEARNKLREERPMNIIIDERLNPGGDLNITRNFVQAIPRLIPENGKVFAIVSGRTFSAGISTVAYLEQAMEGNLVIVGEPVGDQLEFWAEGDLVILPNSGAAILMATERHNYLDGCQEEDCHAPIREHPIRVRTLEPDYYTPLTYAAFAASIDPAMDKIADLIAQ